MHEKNRKMTAAACLALAEAGLCAPHGGVVSLFDRRCGVILISPAGAELSSLTPIDVLAVTSDGTVIDGDGQLPPEYETHREIYEAFGTVSSIVSADPDYAVSFAQAGRPIKPYGTAHARMFGDQIPCTRKLTPSEIENDYQANIGRLIVETLRGEPQWVDEVAAALVCSDEVYTLGKTPDEAVRRMAALERIAKTAFFTELLQKTGAAGGTRMQEDLLRLCFERSHKEQ